MITFSGALLLLLAGYFIYGLLVEKVFGADKNKATPCYTHADGVDFIPMPTWKVFLIQFLNIAGTGPIFGAILGVLYGPAAYLWIVLGCIFGGAVHDYLSGMISIRKGGVGLAEIIGDELGSVARLAMRVFTLLLMVMVGTVFVTSPAGLLSNMIGADHWWGTTLFWTIIIFLYYVLATLLPIDKLIGKIYPVFGIALLSMAVGLLWGIFSQSGTMPEITEAFTNHNPDSLALPLFPGLFITIACGAVSGFHATQSPMMARCMKNEKYGRPVFYGSMITEGIVALIWAAATVKFADSLPGEGQTAYEKLLAAMTTDKGAVPAIMVNQICNSWLGSVGAVLAILGVVAAPITSGDTAFRSGRLIAADFLHFKQGKLLNRLLVAVPLFVISFILMQVNFQRLWNYFGWLNQSLSVFTFWAITVWLASRRKCFYLALVPALWMTLVCTQYILIAPIGFSLLPDVAIWISGGVCLVALLLFIRSLRGMSRQVSAQKPD